MLAVHLKYNFKGIFHQSHHQGLILKKERERERKDVPVKNTQTGEGTEHGQRLTLE